MNATFMDYQFSKNWHITKRGKISIILNLIFFDETKTFQILPQDHCYIGYHDTTIYMKMSIIIEL